MKYTLIYAFLYLLACLAMVWANQQPGIPESAEKQHFQYNLQSNKDSAVRTLTMVNPNDSQPLGS